MAVELGNTQVESTAGQTTGGTTAPPSQGEVVNPPSTTSSASTTPTGGSGGQAQPQSAGIRDTLRGLGVDTTNFQSDESALQYLANLHRQQGDLSQLAQYGRVYVQHADRFQAFLRQQQEEERKKQQEQQGWWKAPEYDPNWLQKLTRDPTTGALRAVDGADPNLVQKYMSWVEHQRGFLDRFAQNPIEAIRPGIEQVVQQVAQQIVQQHLSGYQENVSASQLIEHHSPWIHQRDSQGQLVMDRQTGRPQLTELGQRYAGYVRQAEQMGLSNTQAQHDYALGLVQRDFLMQQHQAAQTQQAQQTANQQAQQQFLEQGNRPNQGANVQGTSGGAGNAPRSGGSRSLKESMLKNLQAAGFQPGSQIK